MPNRLTKLFTAHQRDPQAATTLASYQGVGMPQIPTWNADDAYNKAYIINAFVYAAVKAVATDLSSLPFRAHSELPDDPKDPHDYDKTAPLAKLLGPPPFGPAPKLSARKLWSWTVAQRIITGRSGWEIEQTAGGQPLAFWPLTSSRLSAIPSQGGTKWFSGFRYSTQTGNASSQGSYRSLSNDEVFYSWIPSQNDFRQPESPLQAARIPIDLAVLIDRYDHAFIRNDATPSLLVTHQAIDDRDRRDAWRDQFRSDHSGVSKAGSTVFNEVEPDESGSVVGTIAVERLGMSQRDAQMAQRYATSIQAIMVAIGVPLSRLMDSSGRTFNNGDVEYTNYWTSTIKPLAVDLADDVNSQLSPRLGRQFGWFDMSDVAALKEPESQKFSLSTLPDLRDKGLISDAWAAEQIGAPTDGLSSTPQSAGQLSAPVSRLRARVVKSANRKVDAVEASWRRQFDNLFERQAASAVSKLNSSRGSRAIRDNDPGQIFDDATWATETYKVIEGLNSDIAAQAIDHVVTTLDHSGDINHALLTSDVQKALSRSALSASKEITATTKTAIGKQLSEGVFKGEAIPDLAKRVRAVFDDAKKSRSELIARTEVNGAFNKATLETAKGLGPAVANTKQWLATSDSRTRPEHAAADGQTRGLMEAFNVGGAHLQEPSEPRCRCTILIGQGNQF